MLNNWFIPPILFLVSFPSPPGIFGSSSIQVPGPPFFIFVRGKGGPGTWIELEPVFLIRCYANPIGEMNCSVMRMDSTLCFNWLEKGMEGKGREGNGVGEDIQKNWYSYKVGPIKLQYRTEKPPRRGRYPT